MSSAVSKTSYRGLLKSELDARCRRNSRYSLRSFARDLEISPARLSDVIRGRYGLSREAAGKIAGKLGMSARETTVFCDLVDSEHARARKDKMAAAERLRGLSEATADQRLTLDLFETISEWYHYAILELTLVQGFRGDPAWIATRLGISPHSAEAAMERLKRLDLLEGCGGRIRARTEFTTSPHEVPSDALKKFHAELLKKAIDAIRLQSLDRRDITSMVLAFDRRRMGEAKDKCRREAVSASPCLGRD